MKGLVIQVTDLDVFGLREDLGEDVIFNFLVEGVSHGYLDGVVLGEDEDGNSTHLMVASIEINERIRKQLTSYGQ